MLREFITTKMFKISSTNTLKNQAVITFISLVCIYILFAINEFDAGVDGTISFIFFMIIASVFSSLTIVICLILGLPIRLNSKIYNWWNANFYIPIILTILGLAFLYLSTTNYFLETAETTYQNQKEFKQIPNMNLQITGWFLTAFSVLHLFPSNNLKIKIRSIFKKRNNYP
ncbi:MAG: hypothetical protein ACOYMA_08100 [Bacteroidia bacterium]